MITSGVDHLIEGSFDISIKVVVLDQSLAIVFSILLKNVDVLHSVLPQQGYLTDRFDNLLCYYFIVIHKVNQIIIL